MYFEINGSVFAYGEFINVLLTFILVCVGKCAFGGRGAACSRGLVGLDGVSGGVAMRRVNNGGSAGVRPRRRKSGARR